MLAGNSFQSLAAVNAKVDDPGPRTRGTRYNTIFPRSCGNAMLVSDTRGEKVAWRQAQHRIRDVRVSADTSTARWW